MIFLWVFGNAINDRLLLDQFQPLLHHHHAAHVAEFLDRRDSRDRHGNAPRPLVTDVLRVLQEYLQRSVKLSRHEVSTPPSVASRLDSTQPDVHSRLFAGLRVGTEVEDTDGSSFDRFAVFVLNDSSY